MNYIVSKSTPSLLSIVMLFGVSCYALGQGQTAQDLENALQSNRNLKLLGDATLSPAVAARPSGGPLSDTPTLKSLRVYQSTQNPSQGVGVATFSIPGLFQPTAIAAQLNVILSHRVEPQATGTDILLVGGAPIGNKLLGTIATGTGEMYYVYAAPVESILNV